MKSSDEIVSIIIIYVYLPCNLMYTLQDEEEKKRDESKVNDILAVLDSLAQELKAKSILNDAATLEKLEKVFLVSAH